MVICSREAMSSLPDNISWSDTVSVGGGSTGGEESDRPMLQQPTLPLPPPGGGVLSHQNTGWKTLTRHTSSHLAKILLTPAM